MVDVAFNPFDPDYAANPYAQFAELRKHDPVHMTPFGVTIVTRYDDVLALLRNPALSVDDTNATPTALSEMRDEIIGETLNNRKLSMLDRDPPDHTRLRRLVSRAFTPRAINDLEPRIRELVHQRLDAAVSDGGMEAISGLAFPLPFDVISEMLGLPETDRDRVRTASGTIVRSLEAVVDPDVMRAIAKAGVDMAEIIAGFIEWKRDNPGDDLLTKLIAVEDEGDSLNDEELGAQVALLFIAGHETTVNLIGNGLLALARNPEQYERLREDVDLVPKAVEEFLRYDSPVQQTRRINLEPIEIDGVALPAGSFILGALASANRDESRWGPTADQLDVGREDAREHLSFGGGAHFCLGAALARLEARVAFETIVERHPTVELAGEIAYNGRINLRGLDTLPLRLG